MHKPKNRKQTNRRDRKCEEGRNAQKKKRKGQQGKGGERSENREIPREKRKNYRIEGQEKSTKLSAFKYEDKTTDKAKLDEGGEGQEEEVKKQRGVGEEPKKVERVAKASQQEGRGIGGRRRSSSETHEQTKGNK